MSLHIESTEEALAALKQQRVKNLAAAVSVSALGVAMTGLLLYLANIITFLPEPPSIITYPSENQGPEEPDTPELVRKATRPSNSPAGQQVKVIASSTPLHIAVPIPDLEQDAPTEEFFTGIEIGDGIAFDDGEGPGWDKPDTDVLSKRCDLNDRMKRITENGGTPQCEEAVVKSLKWLQKQQNRDGSWGDGPQNYKCAMTGLSLLSYLAHCETPLSEDFGDTVLKGISFLVDQGMKSPVISLVPQMNEVSYDHAIATYALCEAYTFCKQMDIPSIANLEQVVTKAVDQIMKGQNANGGWAYNCLL